MTESHEGDKMHRIVDAALAVFNRRGFHQATMQDIADEAGVGKGTTYLYFRSKESLLDHIFGLGLTQYAALVRQARELDLPAVDRLRAMAETMLAGALQSRNLSQFVLEGGTGLSQRLKRQLLDVRQRIIGELVTVIEQGCAAGQLRPVDPLMTAHVISGALTSLATAMLWDPGVLPVQAGGPREQAARLADEFMRVLALEAAATAG